MSDSDIDAAFACLVDALTGPEALPAGGAAGVTATAMGVALGRKVLRFTPDAGTELRDIAARLEELAARLRPEFANDSAAFADLLAAFRRPREDPDRRAAIRGAWRRATEAPVTAAELAAEAAALLAQCEGRVNPNLAGDLGAARELVATGRRIAAANARENAAHLDAEAATALLARLESPAV